MAQFRKVLFCAASGAAIVASVREVRKRKVLQADTAFMHLINITDLPGPRYYLVNDFWVPEPQPQMLLQNLPVPFPNLIGPNVMNNNLDFDVHLVDRGDENGAGEDGFGWIGPSAVGTIGSTLFHQGFSRLKYIEICSRISLLSDLLKNEAASEADAGPFTQPPMLYAFAMAGLPARTVGCGYIAASGWSEIARKSASHALCTSEIVSRKISVREAQNRARRILEQHREEIGDPGLVVGVSIDGRVVWAEGLGYADFENRVPCRADTVMRIASIGKALSMTIVAKLWEEGKLDLDKPVQEYVPDFPVKTFDGKEVAITCRHLVSHLSGIRHYSKTKKPGPMAPLSPETLIKQEKAEAVPGQVALARYNEFQEPEYYFKEPFKTTKDSLGIFKDDPLLVKPGEEFLYTTHGWTLLCAVIEAVTKRKLTECLKDLFRDLDMQNTFLDEHEPIVYNRSRNYRRDMMGRLRNAPYVDNSYKWAGGGLLSTAGDLLKFAHVLVYSYQWREGSPAGYLKPSTLRSMWSVVDKTRKQSEENGYGMGWMVVPEKFVGNWCLRQPLVAYHTGGAIGASSVLTMLPRKQGMGGMGQPGEGPQGVVVTLIANLEQAALFKKSVEIARIFDQVDLNCTGARR